MDHLLRLKLASIRDKSGDQMAGRSWPRYITHLDLMDQARADAAAVGLSALDGTVLSCGSLCAAPRRPHYIPVRGVNPAMGVRGQQPPPETIAPSVDGMRSLPPLRSQAKCWLFLFTGPSIGSRSPLHRSSVLPQRQDAWQHSVDSYPGQRCHQLAGALSAVSCLAGMAADGYNGTHMASCLHQMFQKVLHPSIVIGPTLRSNVLMALNNDFCL